MNKNFMILLYCLGFILLIYTSFLLLVYFYQDRFIYYPFSAWQGTPDEWGLAYQDVSFTTSDDLKLSAWFIPAPEAKGTMLFFHGNGGNISHRRESLVLFHRLGVNTLIVDYRGYGQSEGHPSERGTYQDAEAAWRYLTEERDLSPDQIIIFGRSLGGAVATYLASQHPPKALILESTFTSVPDIAIQHYPYLPLRFLLTIRYDTLTRIKYLQVPLLIIHSPDDSVIPYDHGQRIFEAAQEPKQFLQIWGGHNEGFLISESVYEDTLRSFLDSYLD